jgi:hypothetical protein
MPINPTVSEWLNLIARWIHVFAGIMWVGTTYYFTWLDARLSEEEKAVRATGNAAAHKVGGRRPYALAGERAWLLARLSERPDITLRALAAELAERGIKVSYFAVWHFFEHEGISFKKKPARQRAGPAGRRASAGAVEEVSGPA